MNARLSKGRRGVVALVTGGALLVGPPLAAWAVTSGASTSGTSTSRNVTSKNVTSEAGASEAGASGTSMFGGAAPEGSARGVPLLNGNAGNILHGKGSDTSRPSAGSTARAGKSLVFAATRGGRALVGALTHSDDRFHDAVKILDHGFRSDSAKNLGLRELPGHS